MDSFKDSCCAAHRALAMSHVLFIFNIYFTANLLCSQFILILSASGKLTFLIFTNQCIYAR